MNKDAAIPLLMDFYGKLLADAQYQDLEYYYFQDLSLSEIANNVGKTRQGVYDSIKKAEKILTDLEDKLCLIKKFENIKISTNRISYLSRKIKEINRRSGNCNEINICAEEILNLSKEIRL